ncbi:redox-sensitive transcriptional activator SoxR [Roseinatronobacter alkalisoli]|uniref:Redox-sensitive transcriptional activator SoxR n=1 Tax=Roseinatronobacter alkalisoli TaxID=3028235 RepID=A0ABT5T8Y6_9RHOB|nr:redox-sensitive transcriptional activator SoxR [Roseinatronobacter sp. HJB301]MDD7970846.1 redox-sensitive transcriptional activator SoxR [Roseinatronobacter sp. HJB301]
METTLTINQISRRSGVASSALRYYEERGLIVSERAGSGHRRFPRHVLRRLAFITFAQKLGMKLDEIKVELDKLPTGHVPTGDDWTALSEKWTARVDEQIAQLQRLRDGLSDCIGCGCLSLRSCKMLNAGDALGQRGPGPRGWVEDLANDAGTSA